MTSVENLESNIFLFVRPLTFTKMLPIFQLISPEFEDVHLLTPLQISWQASTTKTGRLPNDVNKVGVRFSPEFNGGTQFLLDSVR